MTDLSADNFKHISVVILSYPRCLFPLDSNNLHQAVTKYLTTETGKNIMTTSTGNMVGIIPAIPWARIYLNVMSYDHQSWQKHKAAEILLIILSIVF